MTIPSETHFMLPAGFSFEPTHGNNQIVKRGYVLSFEEPIAAIAELSQRQLQAHADLSLLEYTIKPIFWGMWHYALKFGKVAKQDIPRDDDHNLQLDPETIFF